MASTNSFRQGTGLQNAVWSLGSVEFKTPDGWMSAGSMLTEMLQQNNKGLKALIVDPDLDGWHTILGALETKTCLESLEGVHQPLDAVMCRDFINSLPSMRGLKKLSLCFKPEVAEMKEDLFDAIRRNTSLEVITVVADFVTADDQTRLQLLAERNIKIKDLFSLKLLPCPSLPDFDLLQCKNAADVMRSCIESWGHKLELKQKRET